VNLEQIVAVARNKTNFAVLQDYIDFCCRYLEYVAEPDRFGDTDNLQARIVCQNEKNYRFYQYRADGYFNITRPINTALMYDADQQAQVRVDFLKVLRSAPEVDHCDAKSRDLLRRSIYTIQQSIGAALDALPAGNSNTARKINGDLFERLMRLLIGEIGFDCKCGIINVPVVVDYAAEFFMSYQHDLLVYKDGELKIIGSVKTSSKDRLDKVFIDKFLYNRLTGTATPHIAIFLNDVQRKRTPRDNEYGVSTTFLPGHFRGYTIKLNPLDGVYYCDIRPTMEADAFLSQHIQTIDRLLCDDLKGFLKRPGLAVPVLKEVREDSESYLAQTADETTDID
jgi:hypothetical protein